MSSWQPTRYWFHHLDYKYDPATDVVVLNTTVNLPEAKSFQTCMSHFQEALGEKAEWLTTRNYTASTKIFALENNASFDVKFTLTNRMTPEQRTEYYLRWG